VPLYSFFFFLMEAGGGPYFCGGRLAFTRGIPPQTFGREFRHVTTIGVKRFSVGVTKVFGPSKRNVDEVKLGGKKRTD